MNYETSILNFSEITRFNKCVRPPPPFWRSIGLLIKNSWILALGATTCCVVVCLLSVVLCFTLFCEAAYTALLLPVALSCCCCCCSSESERIKQKKTHSSNLVTAQYKFITKKKRVCCNITTVYKQTKWKKENHSYSHQNSVFNSVSNNIQ